MSILKRYFNKGNCYFITSVTYKRMPILLDNADLLIKAIQKMKYRLNYDLIAWVILHDHFHFLIQSDKYDPSDILHRIKLSFGILFRNKYKLKHGRIWQSRYWDHVIRDENDLRHHIDYIHYNPVKHGLTINPFKYKSSSLNEFSGMYPPNWGINEEIIFDCSFGDE